MRLSAHPRLLLNGWVLHIEGMDGLGVYDHPKNGLRLIHSIAEELDGEAWAHTSFSRSDRKLPTWGQTRDLYRLIYPDLAGVVVIPPESTHVNIAEVMHVWTCLTRPTVPDFTSGTGSI